MKTQTKVGLVLAGVAVIAAAAVVLTADTLAKGAVETGSERALGVETSVGGIRLGVLGGNFGISSYSAKNPEGFTADALFRLDRADLSVGWKSVLGDTVVVERLSLEGIAVDLEMLDGKSNYGAVLDHMKGLRREEASASGKRLVIDDLVIRNVTAHARFTSEKLGVDHEATVTVPEIHMKGVGRKQGGVTVSELVSLVLARVVNAVLREGGDIPGQLRAALEGRLQGVLQEHRGLMDGVSLSGGEGAVKEAVDDAADKAKDTIKGLLKGN
jgi:hypothetical protein